MQLIDTHCHIYLDKFAEDLQEVIDRAANAGVTRLYMPNIDRGSWEDLLAVEKRFPGTCLAMAGLHPCSVREDYREQLEFFEGVIRDRPVSAIGEIGIDLYWDKSTLDIQLDAYHRQMSWAREHRLPVVIHSRESLDHTIRGVRRMQDGRLSGIFHCFTGTVQQAKEIGDLGFYIGIGGILTFRNAGLDKVAAELPLEIMVLETDAPYLAPAPYRGKRNEPSYVRLIAQKLADIKGISLEKVAKATSGNAEKVYPDIWMNRS